MNASARLSVGRLALITAASLLLAACAGGGVTTPGDDEEEPGLDRSELEVTVRVSEEDRAVAEALGWEDRRVPGARVTLMKESAAAGGIFVEDSITAATGPEGIVLFSDLLPSTTYRVKISRELEGAEVEQIRDIRSGVRVVAGGTKAETGQSIEVTIDANQTGSLVISEVVSLMPGSGEPGVGYDFAHYVELYNNSDRTISLDGMVIGRALSFDNDLEPARPCSATRSFQTDSSGIWSRFFQAFPGSGAAHTVAPGETVVVATDAIDHSEVASSFPDLRDADFEFEGSSDPDNPDVPNMEQIGLDPWFFGHGLNSLAFAPFSTRIFLAQAVDVGALRRGRPDPAADNLFVQFPAEEVIDVTTTVDGVAEEGREYCGRVLHQRFEEVGKVWTRRVLNELLVHIRRGVGETENGRPILLDTNTSSVDFRWGMMTPDGLVRP